ncbi:MAG: hypothetical protein AB2A00_27820 [Myxococcota bacterium]
MTTLKTLKANSLKSAERALAAGQITQAEFKSLTDGRVSKKDLDVAKSVLADARAALRELKKDGASERKLAKAEEEVKVARGLETAVRAQQEAQVSRPSTGSGKGVSRPSTGSGKGVSRPSTGSGKGTSRPSSGGSVRRPSTGSGKGVSRPSTNSGKGVSRPSGGGHISRPSTGGGKGVTRPSTGTGKGTPR